MKYLGTNNAILVTGSRGYVGENLVEALRQQLWEVREYDIKDGKDILDVPTLEKEMKGCVAVFNCAAISGIGACEKNKNYSFKVNVDGANNVVATANKYNVKPILFSSQAAVSKEKSEYGKHKKLIELFHTDNAVVLRPSNIYGGKGFYEKKNTVIVNFSRDRTLEVYGGKQKRDFVHINKVIDMCVASIWSSVENGVYDVCSGEQISIQQLALLTSVLRGGIPIRWLREEDRFREEEQE